MSKLYFTIDGGGDIVDLTTEGNLYQGMAGVAEYHLKVADSTDTRNILPTDTVLINFGRPDGKQAPCLMTYDEGLKEWVCVTNGWETDVEIPGDYAKLLISFEGRRYSTVSAQNYVRVFTSGQMSVNISPSTSYVPLGIATPTEDEILLRLTALENEVSQLGADVDGKVDKTTEENVVYATDRFGAPTVIEYDNSYTSDPFKGTIVKRTGIGGIMIVPGNTSVLDYAVSLRTVNTKIEENVTNKLGEPYGIATLDGGGKIPSGQLPSYVDDVIEVDSYADLPETGESGKIYVTKDTNLTYRWGGSGYVEISKSLALGTGEGMAYNGNLGAELYTFTSPAFEGGKSLQDKLDLKADKTELIKEWLTPTVTDNEFAIDCADNRNYVLDNAQDIEISITNAYNGYVGRIITNTALTLPVNSTYDADFDYITIDDDFPLYEYQFDCIEIGGIMYYKWSRKATQVLGV